MNCKFCGAQIDDGAMFCNTCGMNVSNSGTVSLDKSAMPDEATIAASAAQPIDAYAQVSSPYAPQATAATVATATAATAYGQNSSYDQQSNVYGQNSYSQSTSYDQQNVYGQQSAYGGTQYDMGNSGGYGQQSAYSQNSVYGQQSTYSQNSTYGQSYDQNSAYGYNQNSVYGNNSVYTQNSAYGSGNYQSSVANLATAGPDNSKTVFVLGLLSLIFAVTFYFSFSSLIMAPISLVQYSRNVKLHDGVATSRARVGKGLAIGGLVVAGITWLIIILFIILAIAEEL